MFAIDLYEDLIEMPFPIGIIRGKVKLFLPDLVRKQRAKSIPPIADCFMTNIDAPFMKKVFNIAKRKGKPDIHHHSQADDLGEVLK